MTQEELQNKFQDQLFFSYSANVIAYEVLLLLCSVILIGKSQTLIGCVAFAICAGIKAVTYQINCSYIKRFQEGRPVTLFKKIIPVLDYVSLGLFIVGLILLFIK